MADRALKVVYTADTAAVQRGMNQINAANAKMSAGLQAHTKKVDGLFGKVKNFASGAGAAYGLAGAAVVKFGVDSVKAYQEHQGALILLQNAIKNSPALVGESTKAFEDQATALQNLSGVQDEEIINAQTVLSRFKLT